MGPYAGVDYYSPYLIFNSLAMQLSTPTTKRKGVEWGRSFQLVEHVCMCLLISKTTIRKIRESTEKGGGKGVRADLMSLNRHFMEFRQPHA